MLNFKSFLKESTLLSEELILEANHTKDVENDDKGKMHELLLAKYLHPDSALPEHHRSESENEDHAGTPTQVHDRLKKKMGDNAYNQIDQHAQQTAKTIHAHLKSAGHVGDGQHIGRVFWTSNADKPGKPGDHEKTTGVKDVNSNADVIVRVHDKDGKTAGHVGVSAKYGSHKPNYRNPGLDSMEKTAGLNKGSLKKLSDNHHAHMEELGYNGPATQRHIQYKIDKMGIDKARAEHSKFEGLLAKGKTLSSKNKMTHEHLTKYISAHDSMKPSEQAAFEQKAQTRSATAEVSALHAKRAMAKHFSEGMAKKSDDELREIVRQHVSAPTHIPHIVAHSQVKDSGDAESHVVPSHSIADDHLANFDKLHVVHNGGISTVIKGVHKKTGKVQNVGSFTMKGSSGPHKGVAGTFSLS